MARRKRKPFIDKGIKDSEKIEENVSVEEPEVEEAVKERPSPVIEETAEQKTEILRSRIDADGAPKTEVKESTAGMLTDGMPEFLRSANSTIRRDGPYKNYSGNADVLRHKRREPEKGRSRKTRKGHDSKRERREGILSTETISLIALVIILGTIFFCAIKHVEMRELSLPILLVTVLITIIMGVLLGDTPSYVTLILVALIIIAGAITGFFSEVITGALFFLGTVLAIKGRFE
ncbi:MAG: hypothetical protein K5668_05965 [Lachnospiraceae bacterium]|nr:hypothetical protein [Lachnospiraceae bacterium]